MRDESAVGLIIIELFAECEFDRGYCYGYGYGGCSTPLGTPILSLSAAASSCQLTGLISPAQALELIAASV